MPKRTPIRIIVGKLDMSRHDQSIHSSSHQSTSLSRRTHRTHGSSHAGRRHIRHERSQSRPAKSIRGLPSPSMGATDVPHSVASPPFLADQSPSGEPTLLPGGGIQVPQGFRLSGPDQGSYRPRDIEDGDPESTRVLGRMGLGMFKGLRNIPAAIVKAGRSYGPRNQERREMSPVPETDHEADPRPGERHEHILRESPVQDYVDLSVEPEEEEAPAREEQLLYEYIQRKRMSRDRAFRKRSRHEGYARSLPVPQSRDVPPALVPGAHTPAETATVSQNARSQTGRSDTASATLEARLEAEEMRREGEALEQAHERERARKIYAAEAVRQPGSSLSSDQPHIIHDTRTSHRRSSSERQPPRPSSRVFSRWSAERDASGNRKENRAEEDLITSLISRVSRFMQQIHDLPWVGDRVAADYVPGGVKPKSTSSQYYSSSPRSGVTFLSPQVHSASSGSPLPVPAVQAATPKAGKSWYTGQEEILVLPDGVDPPPGFVPYPFPVPQLDRTAVSANGEGAASASNHTPIETPPAPPVAGSSASGPGYLNGYQYVPAQVSNTGQPYILVPMSDGRNQPLIVPGPGRRKKPAYLYPHPGPRNFIPVSG